MPTKRDLRETVERGITEASRELVELVQRYWLARGKLADLLATHQRLFGSTRAMRFSAEVRRALAFGGVGSARRPRRRPTLAVKAATALTQRGEVLVPVSMGHIMERLIASGLAGRRPPTRATLQSAIVRSRLFEQVERGQWRLMQPVHEARIESRESRARLTAGTHVRNRR